MISRAENLDNILRQLMADNGQQVAMPTSLTDKQRMMRALMNIWEPKTIAQDFLSMQDAELQLQAEEKGVVTIESIAETNAEASTINAQLFIWQGDITRLQVDAIVNAANAQGLGCWVPLHNCIDNCIHSAAGIQLRKACNDLLQGKLLGTGEAMMTKGYNLPAKHVIHTVGPIIPQGSLPTEEQEEQLAQCYRSCLDLAEQANLESIAFCCISTGVFNFPNQRAAKIAIETVRNYPRHSVKTVVFNVFLEKDKEIYRRLMVHG